MADIKSPEERSLNMSRICAKDTKPEVYIRKKLFEQGFRYRKNVSYIPGHPDIWLARYHTAIFVNGCFWHRHNGCKYAYTPKSKIEFWNEKFRKNVLRDEKVKHELQLQGIKVLVIWECTVKPMMKSDDYEKMIISKLKMFFSSEDMYIEL